MNTFAIVMFVTTFITAQNVFVESVTRWETVERCEEVAAIINRADGGGKYAFFAACYVVPSNSVGLDELEFNR
jgi:hypothetical protein